MKKRIERWLLRHWRWYANAKLYVVADATDNSVTFSKALFRLLDVMDREVEPKVYVFEIKTAGEPAGTVAGKEESVPLHTEQGKQYGFCINPPFEQETQLADIQYNAKHHCVGFECLVPTVNRIFYDYGLKAETRAKLTVVPARINGATDGCHHAATDGTEGCCDTATNRTMEYYIIMPPKRRLL